MSRLLLDTQILLWSLAAPERLSARVRELIVSADSELHFSVASLWEIALKLSIGKLELGDDWLSRMQLRLSELAVRWLPIGTRHCELLAPLPFHHKDSFDRMLILQSNAEGLSLVSADAAIDAYEVTRIW